ncbi:MAG: helix-turn-helix transcriptional regulator [Pseudomonadota bacterium]
MPVRIHLSRLMGERKLKIADIARETDINRGTLTRLYYEKAERVDLDVIEILCRYLECEIGELMEIVDE